MDPKSGNSSLESTEVHTCIRSKIDHVYSGEMDPSNGNLNHESTEVPIDMNQQQQNLERSEQTIQWLPSLHLLTDRNPRKEELRLHLLKAAIEGNIDAVKSQFNNPLFSNSSSSSSSASSSSSPLNAASPPSPFNVAITEKHETIFHVAAGANQTDFLEKMIDEIAADDLKLQNVKGNTAFCFAVMAGNISIAEKMLKKKRDLLTIRGGGNLTPLNLAAMFGEREMAIYLYRQYYRGTLTLADKKQLLFDSIDTTLYDLARELLEDEDDNENELAMTEYEHGSNLLTPLHRLALTPFHLLDQNRRSKETTSPNRVLESVKCLWEKILEIGKSKSDRTTLINQALALVECLWKKIFKAKRDQVWDYLKEHRDLLFTGAQLGNFKFLGKLIELYPDLVHLKDDDEQTIFHIAIMHRHDDLFKLINQIGFNKHVVASNVDIKENTLLHLAATYPHPRPLSMENSLLHRAAKYPDPRPLSKENILLHLAAKYSDLRPLSTVSSATLEMQRELRIFKDVEKLVMPSFRELKNSEGKTPRELFTSTHACLQKDGEKWMRSIASQCLLVATIIATVVFQPAFTVPGGKDDNEGRKIVLRIFAMAKVIASSSSSISILTNHDASIDFKLFIQLMITLDQMQSSFFVPYLYLYPCLHLIRRSIVS
ncbi:hypothetical protein Pint_21559 [Pistacia integerrima]|uniref:Uncharacterized protein n=1 Tax=Pistacia integerrima TaxID=434235 RepID=A0ACC0XD03_9ROSI|nr:hypothetical protein Pint_21559 [Pistacia integerrima]